MRAIISPSPSCIFMYEIFNMLDCRATRTNIIVRGAVECAFNFLAIKLQFRFESQCHEPGSFVVIIVEVEVEVEVVSRAVLFLVKPARAQD